MPLILGICFQVLRGLPLALLTLQAATLQAELAIMCEP